MLEALRVIPGGNQVDGLPPAPSFDIQKVFIKFKSNMSFCLDFLRNWDLHGTLIWESMSSGRQKKLMKLAEGKVIMWSQKIGKK